jgi:hypothetical protein
MVPENAALFYLSHGWSVVPVLSRSKQPLVRWQQYLNRLASYVEVHAWFRRWPDAGVGIITGKLSGLAILDVDPKHDGIKSLPICSGSMGRSPAPCA